MFNELLTFISIVLTLAIILVTVDSLRWLVFEKVYVENKYFCITDKDCESMCACKNVIYSSYTCEPVPFNVNLSCSCRGFYCVARAT
ncbi:MAG: hypothetical protein OH319_01120 [Candidatus Parvarchaeota archaeon]|nr:hypothetical protein [Candidatus Jingweiarchaeum tengchongense]MCW1299835.1 hypothetical protein [Candidatus Jingweiarchaeum tengchongense]MCW1310669.1 hypothetical protein [Candidatus Jingweiarchaeum tengchongense]